VQVTALKFRLFPWKEIPNRNLIVAAVFQLLELIGVLGGICNEKQNGPSKATQ
jgi:hypothetical protein